MKEEAIVTELTRIQETEHMKGEAELSHIQETKNEVIIMAEGDIRPHEELQRVKKLKTPDVGSQKTSSVSERHTNESHVQKKDNLGTNKECDAWNDYYDDGWNENVKQRKSFPKSNIKDASSVSKRQTNESHVQKKESLGMNKEYDAWNDDYDDGWNENVKQRKSFPKSNIKDASSVSKGQTNESHVQKK
ncbi:hypothetical protein JTB14_036631 [Gonioctena quinquepunctata]|nr:hypothetical protein JTB14_036631 [Gonioctena quinquepunctata]